MLVTAAACSTPPAPQGEIYRWVDEDGVAHYALDRGFVPAELQAQLELPLARPASSRRAAQGAISPGPSSAATAAATPAVSAPSTETLGNPPDSPSNGEAEPGEELDPRSALDHPGLGITSSFDADEFRDDTPEMRELWEQIRDDREEIKRLISAGSTAQILPDPRLREVAERLARHQAELEALRSGTEP